METLLYVFLTEICTLVQHFKENLQQLHKLERKLPQGKERRGMYASPLSRQVNGKVSPLER